MLVSRDTPRLHALRDELAGHPGRRVAVVADVTEPAAPSHVVGEAIEAFGRLDALLNNAGAVSPIARVQETDVLAWRRCFEVNVFAAMALTREALPHLRTNRGRVVNTATALAIRPVAGLAAYCASKAALLQATRVLAVEEPGVVTCAYNPGPVDTDMMAVLRDDRGGLSPEQTRAFRTMHEEGSLLSPWTRDATSPGWRFTAVTGTAAAWSSATSRTW